MKQLNHHIKAYSWIQPCFKATNQIGWFGKLHCLLTDFAGMMGFSAVSGLLLTQSFNLTSIYGELKGGIIQWELSSMSLRAVII